MPKPKRPETPPAYDNEDFLNVIGNYLVKRRPRFDHISSLEMSLETKTSV